jgi:hypothetical protein
VKGRRQRDLRELYLEDYFLVWRKVFLDAVPKVGRKVQEGRDLEQEDFFMDWRNHLDPTFQVKAVSSFFWW